MKVPWGTKIHYKFRTDGYWVLQENHPTEFDPAGNENNVVITPPQPTGEDAKTASTGHSIIADVKNTTSVPSPIPVEEKKLEVVPTPPPKEEPSLVEKTKEAPVQEVKVSDPQFDYRHHAYCQIYQVEPITVPASEPVEVAPVVPVPIQPLVEPAADSTKKVGLPESIPFQVQFLQYLYLLSLNKQEVTVPPTTEASTHIPAPVTPSPVPAPATEEKTEEAPKTSEAPVEPSTPAPVVAPERPSTPVLNGSKDERTSISSSAPSTPHKHFFPRNGLGDESPGSIKDGKGRKKRNSLLGKIKEIFTHHSHEHHHKGHSSSEN